MYHKFQVAKPVWGHHLKNEWNQFLGFRTVLDLPEGKSTCVHFDLAARSYYRLYINGEMRAHGPARTAHGYLRVDSFDLWLEGRVNIAVEVASYNKPDKYSNTLTLEKGLFIAEISIDGEVVAATGSEAVTPWRYTELLYRQSEVEYISHSREIIEVYEMEPDSHAWRTADPASLEPPLIVEDETPQFLIRRAPYPSYDRFDFAKLLRAGDAVAAEKEHVRSQHAEISRLVNRKWYDKLDQLITTQVSAHEERSFTGMIRNTQQGLRIEPGERNDFFLLWDLKEGKAGFIELEIEVTEDAVLDLLHSDILNDAGTLHDTDAMVRYRLKPGKYHLITFEPYWVRYAKLICRSKGTVTIGGIRLIEYAYPDRESGSFHCNDQELNDIYEAARKTLAANTLDIFMDCPERERGGWLCDSFWMGRAAWMMFGDLGVERDFLENFILTDPSRYEWGFFPEVYPSNRTSKQHITTWSFWLIAQICEYYRRSGDDEFLALARPRIEQFVEGAMSYIGESGLLENLPNVFIDWSLANQSSNTLPISFPANCLFAYVLEEIGRLYQREDWIQQADKIRDILRHAPGIGALSGSVLYPDALRYEDGKLKAGETATEAACFLEAWTGLHDKKSHKAFIDRIVKTMGTCPLKPSDLNIGKANLFIGLGIRHDLLAKLGEIEMLQRELKDVYLPQIRNGPGTLFEGLSGEGSRCHGFNGHAGVLLIRHILGIGEPQRSTKTVRIAPQPGELIWAMGKVPCGEDGYISLKWVVDREERVFTVEMSVPEGWDYEFIVPESYREWTIRMI